MGAARLHTEKETRWFLKPVVHPVIVSGDVTFVSLCGLLKVSTPFINPRLFSLWLTCPGAARLIFLRTVNLQCESMEIESRIYLHAGLIVKMAGWFESQTTAPAIHFSLHFGSRSSVLFCAAWIAQREDDNELKGLSSTFALQNTRL